MLKTFPIPANTSATLKYLKNSSNNVHNQNKCRKLCRALICFTFKMLFNTLSCKYLAFRFIYYLNYTSHASSHLAIFCENFSTRQVFLGFIYRRKYKWKEYREKHINIKSRELHKRVERQLQLFSTPELLWLRSPRHFCCFF